MDALAKETYSIFIQCDPALTKYMSDLYLEVLYTYSDNENYKNNWSVRFSGSMYEKLYEWLQNNKDSMEEIHKFSTWQKVFDEIGGTYERVWSKEELDQGYLNN